MSGNARGRPDEVLKRERKDKDPALIAGDVVVVPESF
jgi:hypothetical protein